MSFIRNNVYIIYSSSSSGTVLDLANGSPLDGTLCYSSTDESANIKTFNQQWLISEVAPKGSNIYTIRNLRGGTYLSLTTANPNGTSLVQGWKWEGDRAGSADAKDQKWCIVPAGDYYRIQSVVAGTYIDIKGGNLTPGGIICSSEDADTATQKWKLHRVSREGKEIEDIEKASPHVVEKFHSYNKDMSDELHIPFPYITLPQSVRDNLYNSKASELRASKWREQIFDCDDFSFVLKAEVAKWGNDFFRADGFAILFGIMFGQSRYRAHAYNWHLNETLDQIVFFEPQTGTEKANIGFDAYFGVF